MSGDLKGPVHPGIAGLRPYQPGKPVEELTRELGIRDIIRLASNENPRGPGEGVSRCLKDFDELSRYPDGSGFRLKNRLAAHHQIDPTRITLGNGSNDVLDLVARVTLEPGARVLMSQHGFVVYYLAATGCGAELVQVAAKDFGTDLDGFLAEVDDNTRLIFIANPNNPTGTWVPRDALTGFLDALPERVWVVLDEAYFEYVEEPDYPDGRSLLDCYPNLVVTRTFSKIHGLASMRVGYALSSPEIGDLLNRARQPFNVNSLGLAAAQVALDDEDYQVSSRSQNAQGMQLLTGAFTRMGLDYIPSVGNFVTVDVGDDASAVYERLLAQGVIVRPVAEYGLPRHLRVTIGLPEENERFLATLERLV
ncbi:MAG: histidinol-phosphate transaminase [Pseudomonadales bacterium]|jgi:histidinol-phosphate aminotransferase|nr:histidinol-phosphate transaminase [Pseudomonadales bacterium]MDP6472056.1 histidinol-phosphate transaminase [Pseudomonadales bacterium]MDP6826671.1 histidinol-phosphate transaminase [Pseudomonadales bacterium]MDP6969968.1 histidinol-phosphate transaminase [Pseudomonadales bacterium]